MENEIRFLEKEVGILLGQIQIQEEYLNQKQNVDNYDLQQLEEMVEKLLKMLALIDAYQYFKSKKLCVNDNIGLFLFVVNDDYSFRIKKFKNDLNDQDIDFNINF